MISCLSCHAKCCPPSLIQRCASVYSFQYSALYSPLHLCPPLPFPTQGMEGKGRAVKQVDGQRQVHPTELLPEASPGPTAFSGVYSLVNVIGLLHKSFPPPQKGQMQVNGKLGKEVTGWNYLLEAAWLWEQRVLFPSLLLLMSDFQDVSGHFPASDKKLGKNVKHQ